MDIKEIFLDAFGRFAAGDTDVLYSVLREDFVEHSPGTPSGRDAWVAYIKENLAGILEVKRVIADDQFVVAHYALIPASGDPSQAVVDIWRFEDGLIAEHWDVVQPVPDDAQVPNGMF